MSKDIINNLITFLTEANGSDLDEVWHHFGEVGALQLDAENSINFCKVFAKEGFLEYPLWLQNDVIRSLFNDADDVIRKNIKEILGKEIFCMALTEEGGGSSFRNVKTVVRKSQYSRESIAQGKKIYITNGVIADHVVFLARTEDQQLNIFYSNDLKNMRREKIPLVRELDKYELGEIEFVNTKCICLYDNNPAKGMFVLNKALSIERFYCAITMLEVAKSVLDIFKNVYKKKTGMLNGSQYWKFGYTKIKTNIRLLENYTCNLETAYIDGKAIHPMDAAMIKNHAAETLNLALDMTAKLLGAQDITAANILTRYCMFAKAYNNAGGTNEVMKEIIGADL